MKKRNFTPEDYGKLHPSGAIGRTLLMKVKDIAKQSNEVIIVKNDEVISSGYNGAPRGRVNCNDLGYCIREKLNIPRGERYELCRSVHAEQNAIISASRKDIIGGTLYIVGVEASSNKYAEKSMPCAMCKRVIINSGIEKIIIRDSKTKYREISVQEFIDNDDSLSGTFGY